MDRSGKEEEISFLSERLTSSAITICADYRGLTAAEITSLRKELRGAGSVGKVVKNTLAKRSIDKVLAEAEGAETEKLKELFNGPSMIIFAGEDPVAPAKVVSKFMKEIEAFELKGGWFEGSFVDETELTALSKLPSKEELLSKLLSLLNAPATKLVQLLNAPARDVVGTLDAHRANLEGGE